MPRLALIVLITLISGTAITGAETSTIPVMRKPERHAEFLHDIAQAKDGVRLVFVGDSITDGWRKEGKATWDQAFAPLQALNLGVAGDRTEHVLWRLTHGELDGYQANLFVVMIGTNNTKSGKTGPQEIRLGIQAVVQEILQRQASAKVLLLGIFPRNSQPTRATSAEEGAEKLRLVTQVNATLAAGDLGSRVRYLDISGKFLVDGKIPLEVMPDQVHPSAKGYQIWADAILPVVTEMLAKP